MGRDFLPRRDADFRIWSANFARKILEAGADYGISPAQSAQCQVLNDAFDQVYRLAANGGTRTASVVSLKNQARAALEREARMLAAIVRANPNVSEGQRIILGLSVHKALGESAPARINKPDTIPSLFIRAIFQRRLRGRLRDGSADRRARPRGTVGAQLFVYQGHNHPADVAKWHALGLITRANFVVTLGLDYCGGVPLWICACWVNARGERGGMSIPISTYLPCPAAQAA